MSTTLTRSNYTEAEIERGLVALALANGNASRAAQQMEGTDLAVSRDTLSRWRRKHVERYMRIQAEILPEIKSRLAEAHTDLAFKEVRVSERIVARINEQLEEPDKLAPKDLAALLGKTDIGSGIHTDKAQNLRGEASTVIEHRTQDFEELKRALASKGIVVDSTAEEIPETAAQLPSTAQ